ncbi:MAG: hypothetical protein ACRDOI_47120 [Trebonia sp.]
MGRLLAAAEMPRAVVQILPAIAHPATASALLVTDSAVYVEHLTGGLVYADDQTVSSLARIMAAITPESRTASQTKA